MLVARHDDDDDDTRRRPWTLPTIPEKNGSRSYDTKLHLMVQHIWRSEKCGVLLRSHFFLKSTLTWSGSMSKSVLFSGISKTVGFLMRNIYIYIYIYIYILDIHK